MVKRILKWTLIAGFVVAVCGFVAFLYLIPPFTIAPPETFIKSQTDLAPSLARISDPATRQLAERGKYLVLTSDCAGCHFPPGPENMVPEMYLAGGLRFVTTAHGTVVSRNLTPDAETGLGSQSDAEIARTLRSGVRPDGRAMSSHAMPWPLTANWTDEDRHAVLVYLRHIPAVRQAIPDPTDTRPSNPEIVEEAYGGRSAGVKR
jgi:hypothetical protein